jgi:hypothetical protein
VRVWLLLEVECEFCKFRFGLEDLFARALDEEEAVLLVVEFVLVFILVEADEAVEVESGALVDVNDVDMPVPVLCPKE